MRSESRRRALFACLAALSCLAEAWAEEWTRFRGANGAGVSSSAGPPIEFGPEQNVVWETEVPFGRSSPVLTADRVYLTAVHDDALATFALDRESGRLLWRRAIQREERAELYKDGDSATPSPVTDGSNVYAFFHEAGLVSYDAAGTQRWRFPLGPFRSYYGITASPILAGGLALMLCDQAEGSFLLALDKDTGREVWRSNRPARLESYTTPILHPASGDPVLAIVTGSRWIDAYDLKSGRIEWTAAGVGSGPISSPVLSGDTLFVSAIQQFDGKWPRFSGLLEEHDEDGDAQLSREEVEGVWLRDHFGWLNVDGQGPISAEDWDRLGREVITESWGVYAIRLPDGDAGPKTLWNHRRNVPYVPSPLVYRDVLYIVKDGIVTSLSPLTGEVLKRGRIGAGSAKVYASPIAADGKIYVATLDGQVVVVTAAGRWEVVHRNDLGEEIWATPAIVDGDLYLRTRARMYRFADRASTRPAPAVSNPSSPGEHSSR